MTTIQILLWGLIALPLLLIALVLGAATFGYYSLRKTIAFAAKSPCPKCGAIIGQAEVLAAKERYAKRVQEMRKQNPGVMFRLVAEWEIECSKCGSKFYFYPNGLKFETASVFAKAE
jgi:ribosomal protein S27AE